MKKILNILFLAIGLLIVNSCETYVEPVPACESQGWGDVIVENRTGFNGYVDCTYTSNGINYEKYLYHGGSYSYQMDKGTVYIWFSFDGSDWVYDTYHLSACEELTYKWYFSKKKSTETLILEIYNNGELVKKTTEFNRLKRSL